MKVVEIQYGVGVSNSENELLFGKGKVISSIMVPAVRRVFRGWSQVFGVGRGENKREQM